MADFGPRMADVCLTKYIMPHWGARDFASIRKSNIAALRRCIGMPA